MSDRVVAESPEAKRFLAGLRGILEVPKSELDARIKRQRRRRQRRGRVPKNKKIGDEA
jgi:hypothetical protein